MISPGSDRPLESNLVRYRGLIQPSIIGRFTHCELTEIFATIEGISEPQNVFTIAVLEERGIAARSQFLNRKRLSVRGLKGWSFGICRRLMTLSEFEHVLEKFDASGVWSHTEGVLGTSELREINSYFVPKDWADPIPLNKLLKNNFWNGSHVLEWADSTKDRFKPFFDKASFLKELAEQLLPFVPIDLAAASDRLGNILIQLPVTVLNASCKPAQDNSGYDLQVAWRPGEKVRPLRATMMAEYDGTITAFGTALIENEPVKVSLPSKDVNPKLFLFDENYNILLGATSTLSWFSQIGIAVSSVSRDEPRTFNYHDRRGEMRSQRILLYKQNQQILVGENREDPNGNFTQKRLYQHDTERVQRERLFEQYGLPESHKTAEHARAISDLRHLIGVHGEEGAWLWDPYLDAFDIIETLFHSPHRRSDLRALSSARVTDNNNRNISDHIDKEGQILNTITGNLLGLRLEYRILNGVHSKFHDRFLIFPKRESHHLAWSLGTSINSLGGAHHILQRVDDGQRVSDAFQALWEGARPEQLVWQRS